MRFILGLSALSALLSSASALAQSVPDPVTREAQRNQERAEQRQKEREDNFRDRQITPPKGQILIDSENVKDSGGPCVPLNMVIVKGMTRYSVSAFETELSALKGPCISIGEINKALRAITNRYVTDGYVTSRAVIGPQDLKDGSLEILVVEGQISSIRSPDKGYSPSTLSAAFARQKGKQLNLRAVEQGVDQLSRLPSYEPNIDIEPADLPGTSKLIVRRKPNGSSVRPSLSFDNDGSSSTGRIQSTLALDADNVLGVADFWSVYYSRDLKSDPNIGSEGMGGFASVPYGWWTVSGSGGRFSYKSVLAGNGQAFSNNGKSWNASLTIDRMLYRDAKTKFSVSGVLALLDTENKIQGIRLSTSSYRQVTGTYGIRVQHKLPDALIGFDLGISRGLKILGANAVYTGSGGASIKARRISGSFSYQTKDEFYGIPLDYTLLVRGQAALNPVFSSGRFSLGGSSTVRGFRDDGISGRYGVMARQQIGFPVTRMLRGKGALETGLLGFVGYDAGAIIAHNDDRFERGQLHASTLGLRIMNGRFQSELSVSMPVIAPQFIKHKKAEFSASVRLLF